MDPSFSLTVGEDDLLPGERAIVKAVAEGETVLGEDNHRVQEVLENLIPDVLLRRLKKAIPDGFDMSEVEFKISFGGKIAGVGVDGEVGVKLTPSTVPPSSG